MAKRTSNEEVNLDESSIYGKNAEEQEVNSEDAATETDLDRLEAITGGAEDPIIPDSDEGDVKEFDALDASTEEEVDALKVNLLQDDALSDSKDGSGRVIDDVAEGTIAGFTETGPLEVNRGAIPLAPGREDTSRAIRQHHTNTEVARSESIVEGNLDEPRDEQLTERKVDDGRGA